MKHFRIILFLVIFVSCKKEGFIVSLSKKQKEEPTQTVEQKNLVYPVSSLDTLSNINKTTSWYQTNKTFDESFDAKKTSFNGVMESSNVFSFYQFNYSTVADYWYDPGMHFYYDFNKDGKKDLWMYNFKSPWPTNKKGLSIFSEYQKDKNSYTIEKSLTSVRKAVVSDMDNDGYQDVVMFSSGYDAPPFPGDSIGIFYPKDNTFQYLSDDIGFFHGGAVGDINNDGLVDIVTFGLPHEMNNTPTIYLNKGNKKFIKSTVNHRNFPIDGRGGYPSIELYDMDGNGYLDMILGSSNSIKIVKNTNGVFDMNNSIVINTRELPMSFIFFDFNNDKKIDIVSNNTYNYNGYNINLYLNNGNNFTDETSKYFDKTTHQSQYTWIKWLRMFDYDKDGDLDIVGEGTFGFLQNKKIHWKNNDNKFIETIN